MLDGGELTNPRSEALNSVHGITAAIVASLDVDQTLAAVARAATSLMNSDVAAIFLVDGDGTTLTARAVHGGTSEDWPGLRLDLLSGINGAAFRTGEVQRVADYHAIPVEQRAAAIRRLVVDEPVHSAITVPVQRRGTRIGTIGVYRRTVRPFEDEEQFLITLLADQAGIALDNALTHAELQATRVRLETLVESTDAIWNPAAFDEVAERVVEQAVRLLPGVECLIAVVPPDRPHLLAFVAGTPGWAAGIVGSVHRLADTHLSSRVIREGRVHETQNFSAVSELNAAMVVGTAIDTARLIPLGGALPDGRSSLGVLGFYRDGNRAFTAAEREVMDDFGKRVSSSLHRAELLRLAESTSARLETAIRVAADLSASLDPSEVVRTVLVRAVNEGHADRAVLLRIEGQDTVVEDFYDVSGALDIIGYRHPIARQPLMQEAVGTRAPTVGGRYDLSRVEAPLDDALRDVLHTATIPLTLDGEVTAVLVLSRRNDLPFLPADVAMFELIGNQAVLALRNARLFEQAQVVTRTQSDFLNMAAHELRTPLSVIAGYVSMMQDGTLGTPPPAWKGPLETLRSKSSELEALISELLVASRLEAGTMPFHGSSLDLREMAASATERLDPRARLLDARVVLRLPEEPVVAQADPEHVSRILDNLLNNALSYSPPAPHVTVRVQGGVERRILVRDRGHGVPAAMRTRIFERFYRIDDPTVRHVPGTGLGLYISRQLAGRMGGTLTLERSSPGKGSTFALTLPAPLEAIDAELPEGPSTAPQ